MWQIEKLLVCPDCGTRPDEWNPKLGGEIDAYYAQSYDCMGCAAREAKTGQLAADAKEYGHSLLEGVKVRLIPKAEHLALMEERRQQEMERRRVNRKR